MPLKRLFLLLLILLAACSPAPAGAWAARDLRWLAPADAPDPALDLTAVYLREADGEMEFRLDLLDIPAADPLSADIYIAIDADERRGAQDLFLNIAPLAASAPGERIPAERGWDWLLAMPAGESPRMASLLSANVSAPSIPRIVRDPLLETVTVAMIRPALPERFSFQVFVTTPGEHIPADQSPVLESDGPAPQGSAPLLLAFNDVLQAATPAEALRAWDGAHSGPRGTRHGLSRLLEEAQRYGIPLALLDLKEPLSLSTLDLFGAVETVRQMEQAGLLLLPEISIEERDAAVAAAFGFEHVSFFYDPQFDSGAAFQFAYLADSARLLAANGRVYIPLPSGDPSAQPDENGLPLAVRRQLIEIALSADPADLLALGGSLPGSTWGSPEYAAAAFAYLAARPYVRALNGASLAGIAAAPGEAPAMASPPLAPYPIYRSDGTPTGLDSLTLRALVGSEARAAPPNALREDALRAFEQLTAPGRAPGESQARAQSLGQVGVLAAAARWAAAPAEIRSCADDLTYDGRPECVLASRDLFAVFESDGARLLLLAAGEDQLIGPTTQLAVDPADPAGVPGAFVDGDAPFAPYAAALEPDGRLVFAAADGSRIKTFRLTGGGLEASYQTPVPVTTRLALIVAPGTRLRPGWAARYGPDPLPDGLAWGVSRGAALEVRATAPVTIVHFAEALSLLSRPEDPDAAYPQGYLLPFPAAIVEVRAEGNFTVFLEPSDR